MTEIVLPPGVEDPDKPEAGPNQRVIKGVPFDTGVLVPGHQMVRSTQRAVLPDKTITELPAIYCECGATWYGPDTVPLELSALIHQLSARVADLEAAIRGDTDDSVQASPG